MWFWEFKKIVKLFQVESEKYFSKMLILAFQIIAILKSFLVHCAECYVHTTLKIMTHILFVWKGPPCLSKISKKMLGAFFFSSQTHDHNTNFLFKRFLNEFWFGFVDPSCAQIVQSMWIFNFKRIHYCNFFGVNEHDISTQLIS